MTKPVAPKSDLALDRLSSASPIEPLSGVSTKGFNPGEGFTPGPWEVCGESYDTQVRTVDWRHYKICDNIDFNGNPENQANARLIAASPDIFEALKGLCACVQTGDFYNNRQFHINRAIAALAKASPNHSEEESHE